MSKDIHNIGRAITVVESGWVFLSENVLAHPKGFDLRNTAVIREWGTTRGLGEIAAQGPTPNTQLDPCGNPLVITDKVLFFIPCTYDADKKPEVDTLEMEGRSPSMKMGKSIVVVESGWVFLADNVTEEPFAWQLHNTHVIREWGTTRGLGEIAEGGPTKDTKLDYCGNPRVSKRKVLFFIPYHTNNKT